MGKLKILLWNIRSWNKNKATIDLLMQEHNVDGVALVETWLKEGKPLAIGKGWTHIRHDRVINHSNQQAKTIQGGGLAIIVRQGLIIKDLSTDQNSEWSMLGRIINP